MDRLSRANLPDIPSVVDRLHGVLLAIQRKAQYGHLDTAQTRSQLEGVLRNLERLDTGDADDSADLRAAINSVKGLLTVIPSPDDDVLATQRDRLGKYVNMSFTLLILTDIV